MAYLANLLSNPRQGATAYACCEVKMLVKDWPPLLAGGEMSVIRAT